jgi:23S rRNA (uracil1939-C5)-methyltransferase
VYNSQIYSIVKKIALEQKLPFYNFAQRSGFLRNLVIRTTTSGHSMAIIGFVYEDRDLQLNFLQEVKLRLPANVSLLYTIVTSPEKGYSDGETILFSGNYNYLTEEIESLQFRFGPRSFYQPNPLQAASIYRNIDSLLKLTGKEFIVDLYTGVGTIACFLAKKSSKVIGIEGSAEAISFAKTNATTNNLHNTSFITGDILETFKPNFVDAVGNPDVVILDPPRSGTLIEIKKTILYASPKKVVYVSCNPVSLAFDLTMLIQGYKIMEIQPFDMFPHTHHLETVVLLEKE